MLPPIIDINYYTSLMSRKVDHDPHFQYRWQDQWLILKSAKKCRCLEFGGTNDLIFNFSAKLHLSATVLMQNEWYGNFGRWPSLLNSHLSPKTPREIFLLRSWWTTIIKLVNLLTSHLWLSATLSRTRISNSFENTDTQPPLFSIAQRVDQITPGYLCSSCGTPCTLYMEVTFLNITIILCSKTVNMFNSYPAPCFFVLLRNTYSFNRLSLQSYS